MIALAALALAQVSAQNPFSGLFPPLCADRASPCGQGDAVPPCRDGIRDGCEPWERDWSTARPRETDYFEIGVADDGARWSIQNLSLVRARGRPEPEIWVQVDNRAVLGASAQSGIFLVKAQCASRRIGTLSSVLYGPTGSPISNEDVQPSAVRYSYAVPGTMSSRILRSACGG